MLKQQQQRKQQGMEGSTNDTAVPPSDATASAPTIEDTGRRGVSNLPAWMTRGADSSADKGNKGTANEPASDETTANGEDTKKRKFVPSEANRDINVRKPRLDVEGGKSLSEIRVANEASDKAAATSFVVHTTKEGILSNDAKFPILSSSPATTSDLLRSYVTAQIVDYLGEEESTLIDFIMKELAKEGGCNTVSLLEEMKMVLDEDAEEFILGLYRKMVQ